MGFNLYLCLTVLCAFDTAEPLLKRININKRTAIIYCVLVMLSSLLEDVFLLDNFSVSIAGCILPLLLCCKIASNLTSSQAAFTLVSAMICSGGSWAVVQIVSQSTDVLNMDIAWVRGISSAALALMFTRNHSSALITSYLSFYLSGYWYHMDMMITGLPNYWAAGSGVELSVTAVMMAGILLFCQLCHALKMVVSARSSTEEQAAT